MNYEKWFDEAINCINKKLVSGQKFEVKGLFEGVEWNKLAPGDKRSFGRYFSSKVKDGELCNVKKSGENKSHHNEYIKL